MDIWCDAIASSHSSWTGLLAPTFSQYFLEDVSEVFCEHKVPIVFSPGAALARVSTIVCPSSCPIYDMDLWCDSIESYTSSWTGLLEPSFSHYFLEDLLKVFCEHKALIIFSPGDAIDGVSTIFCPSSWTICDIDFWCDAIASSTSSWNGVLAPYFLHSFLEYVSDVFCEIKASIFFSMGAAIYGMFTIVIG